MSRGSAVWGARGRQPPQSRPQPARALTPLPLLFSQFNWTPLLWASREGHLPVVETLLGADADPNAKDKVSGWALGA